MCVASPLCVASWCVYILVVPLQVAIATIPLRPTFEYDTVPKQVQHAFLRAKVTNTSRYPLLEGSANVYLDQSYVTETKLTSVAPQEEFSCSLGDCPSSFTSSSSCSHTSSSGPTSHTHCITHALWSYISHTLLHMPCLPTRSGPVSACGVQAPQEAEGGGWAAVSHCHLHLPPGHRATQHPL